MRPESEYVEVLRLTGSGMNDCAIARATGVPRETVREWRRTGRPGRVDAGCPVCRQAGLDRPAYAYLLGLYLGDGCLSERSGGVYVFRVSLDARYPGIIGECARAMAAVSGKKVGRQPAPGCIVVYSSWKHWLCLFPQHGPGPKHKRNIELVRWQHDTAAEHPGLLLRGLIHSDGCRILNRVNGGHYPRYQFSNKSSGIREIFCTACNDYGVHWTMPRSDVLSIARRADVARLDLAVGPKT